MHLANHDVMLWAVSRAPLANLQAYEQRMGWGFPWASPFGSDFNADFGVGHTQEELRSGVIDYNFRTAQWPPRPDADYAASVGTDWATAMRERPGMSAFVLEDGVVYHTYSAYSRGLVTVERLAPRVARAIGAVVVGAGSLLIARAAGFG